MFSSLSLDHGGPANALGASLGRGLSSLTEAKARRVGFGADVQKRRVGLPCASALLQPDYEL